MMQLSWWWSYSSEKSSKMIETELIEEINTLWDFLALDTSLCSSTLSHHRLRRYRVAWPTPKSIRQPHSRISVVPFQTFAMCSLEKQRNSHTSTLLLIELNNAFRAFIWLRIAAPRLLSLHFVGCPFHSRFELLPIRVSLCAISLRVLRSQIASHCLSSALKRFIPSS